MNNEIVLSLSQIKEAYFQEIAENIFERADKDELVKLVKEKFDIAANPDIDIILKTIVISSYKACLYSEIIDLYNKFKIINLSKCLLDDEQIFEEFKKMVDKQVGINFLDGLERATLELKNKNKLNRGQHDK